MSVILEADEHTPLGSETPTARVEEEWSDEAHVSRKTSSQQDDNGPNENIEENDDGGKSTEEDTRGGGDAEGGGGGDRESVEGTKDAEDSKENVASVVTDPDATSGSVKEKLSKSETVSILKVSGSKKSIEIASKGEGEGSLLNKDSHQTIRSEGTHASTDRFSSGFLIVTQILEDLIDTVIKTKELTEEAETVSDQKDEVTQRSSIMTIKSEDEEGSIEIDPELQAQLALEQEAAALQRQQTHLENIALYHALIASRVNLKRRNTFLLKRMYEHYKRKKIEHLFKEMPLASVDMEGKYVRVLLTYEEAHKSALEEEIKMIRIVSTQEEKKQIVESELEEEHKNLITREQEVAKGILSAKSTHFSAKNIENLIQRQISKSKEVAKERLIYFKLRDAAAADETYLKSLENLGDNLTLMEYEQLKMQSQSCVEKLEERDADLHRLRCKATSAIQVLAEIREKRHTLQEDIEAGKVVLHDVNQHLLQTRERVGCEKRRRDMSRSDTLRLRHEAGLLSEPKLLQDYKESLAHKENLLGQLLEWKSKFESQKKNILSLRSELTALQQKRDKQQI